MTSENDKFLSEAADTAADLLADTWLPYAKHTGNGKLSSAARSQAEPAGTSPSLKSWSLQTQTAEMETAGLDFYHLSPHLPEPDFDPPHMFHPVSSVDLDSHSEEYFDKPVQA